MKARELMTSPPVTVPVDASLKDAADLLVVNEINGLPVVDRNGELVGVVTESDLVGLETAHDPMARLRLDEPGVMPHRVRDVMSSEVIALPPGADLPWAASLMLKHHLKMIPVVDAGKVVGILSRRDILRTFVRTDEDIRAELQSILDEEIEVIGKFTATVSDGLVTLAGSNDRRMKGLARRLARTVPGVIDVI